MSTISRGSIEALSSITRRVVPTLSDTENDPAGTSRAVLVNTAGPVSLLLAGEEVAQVETLLAGVVYPYAVKRVLQTGTTASGIRLLY